MLVVGGSSDSLECSWKIVASSVKVNIEVFSNMRQKITH
jgi:hypothetical protein